jgi:RNA polymerase sigma factor (TIGR02999 family)
LSHVTQILQDIERGESGAAANLLPLVYRELRQLAAARVAQERGGAGARQDATSLVHEAFVRLVGPDGRDAQQHWDSRGHFFAAAAEAMRRILVDNARKRRRVKHGGDRARVDLDADCLLAPAPDDDVLALDEALTRFASEEPDKARLVNLRYFTGMTLEECAAAMNISLATAKRHWAYARAWLYCELGGGAKPAPGGP